MSAATRLPRAACVRARIPRAGVGCGPRLLLAGVPRGPPPVPAFQSPAGVRINLASSCSAGLCAAAPPASKQAAAAPPPTPRMKGSRFAGSPPPAGSPGVSPGPAAPTSLHREGLGSNLSLGTEPSTGGVPRLAAAVSRGGAWAERRGLWRWGGRHVGRGPRFSLALWSWGPTRHPWRAAALGRGSG